MRNIKTLIIIMCSTHAKSSAFCDCLKKRHLPEEERPLVEDGNLQTNEMVILKTQSISQVIHIIQILKQQLILFRSLPRSPGMQMIYADNQPTMSNGKAVLLRQMSSTTLLSGQ